MSASIRYPPLDPESQTASERPYPPHISSSVSTASRYELGENMGFLMAEKTHSNATGSMRRDAMPVRRAIPPNYGYDTVGPVSGAVNIEYGSVDERSGSSDSNSYPRTRGHSVRRVHGFATQGPPELRNNSSREKQITVGGEGPWQDAPERNRFEKQQRSGFSSQPTTSREKEGHPSSEAAVQRPTTSNSASSGRESYPSKSLSSLTSGARSLSLKGRHTASLGPAKGNDDSGRGLSKVVPNAKKALEKKMLEKKVLEDVLGIYPAENKLPPGRSAADNFVASIARRFGRKNSTPREDSTSDSKATVQTDDHNQPWSPDSVATGPPVHFAELPGSEVRPSITRSSSRGTVNSYHDRDQSLSEVASGGSRSQSVSRATGRPAVGQFTENNYANLAPLRVNSDAGRHPSAEMRGTDRRTTEDTAYGTVMAEWAESFYSRPRLSEIPSPIIQAPQPVMNQLHRASVLDPEGAIHGDTLSLQHSRSSSSTTSTSRSRSQPHSRSSSLSTIRSSSSRGRSFPRTPTVPASLDFGGTSHAASIDAFQYEFYDTGLGTIGEDDGFHGGTNGIHNVDGLMGTMRLDDKMDYNHDRGYRNSLYEESSDDFQMELEVEAMLAARREKLLAEKARAPIIPSKCALDLEIEAYLTERKKAAELVEEKQVMTFGPAGGLDAADLLRPLRTRH